MHVLNQLGQMGDGVDQVVAEADRMRRGKAQTFQPVDRADGFEQLHEGAFAVAAVCDRRAAANDCRDGGELVAAIEIHDLAKKSYFLHTLSGEGANLRDDLGNGAAAFCSARARHDAKGAMHVATLHDGNECRGLPWGQRLFANGGLRTGFFVDVHDRETQIVHAIPGINDPG